MKVLLIFKNGGRKMSKVCPKEPITETKRYLRLGTLLIVFSVFLLLAALIGFKNPTVVILTFITGVYCEILGIGLMLFGGIKAIAKEVKEF